MLLETKIEVASLKSGNLLSTWTTLGEINNVQPDLIKLACLEKGNIAIPEYLLNIIYLNTGCDAIAIRKLVGSDKKLLWEISCPMSSHVSLSYVPFDPLRDKRLTIVYFINCFVSNGWEMILRSHLEDLQSSMVLLYKRCSVKIIVNCKHEDLSKVAKLASDLLGSINVSIDKAGNKPFAGLHIVWTEEDSYEYPAIKLLYETAKSMGDEDYLIYAHAKGLSHVDNHSRNLPIDSDIASKMLLRNALINIDILDTVKSLSKIGPGLGGSGWMWFNFYIARASYIKGLHEPVKTANRHYYESWLGDFPVNDCNIDDPGVMPRWDDGLSLACIPTPAICSAFEPQDFNDHVNLHQNKITKNLDYSFEVMTNAFDES